MADTQEEIPFTAFEDAIIHSNVAVLVECIREGIDINAVNRFGWAPLLLASVYGVYPIIEQLLLAGADPNVRKPIELNHHTPLHIACGGRRADLVHLLLKHGADPEAKDAEGKTPLYHATFTWWNEEDPNEEIIALLKEYSADDIKEPDCI